jgi:hypothetical protein
VDSGDKALEYLRLLDGQESDSTASSSSTQSSQQEVRFSLNFVNKFTECKVSAEEIKRKCRENRENAET